MKKKTAREELEKLFMDEFGEEWCKKPEEHGKYITHSKGKCVLDGWFDIGKLLENTFQWHKRQVREIVEEAIAIGGEWRWNFINRTVMPPKGSKKFNELIGFERAVVWYQEKLAKLKGEEK